MPDLKENRTGYFWCEDGILHFKSKPSVAQDTDDAHASMQVFRELAQGKRLPAIMEVNGVRSLSRDARRIYTTSPEAVATFAAVALVVSGSVMARALVNFTMTVSRPGSPVRMFETVSDAEVWARSFAEPR